MNVTDEMIEAALDGYARELGRVPPGKGPSPTHQGAMRAALIAALARKPAGDGWKLVPVELTDEMKDVAAHIADGPSVTYQEHWDAMLAAAPNNITKPDALLLRIVVEDRGE